MIVMSFGGLGQPLPDQLRIVEQYDSIGILSLDLMDHHHRIGAIIIRPVPPDTFVNIEVARRADVHTKAVAVPGPFMRRIGSPAFLPDIPNINWCQTLSRKLFGNLLNL